VYQLLVDSGFHHQDMRNMLQMHVAVEDSIPRFSEIGQLAGISNTDWSWAPLFCDLNNDGWKDLYITNGYLRDFTNMDFLKYTFQEESAKAQASGIAVNNWKLVQQMPSTRISNYGYANNRNLTFTDQTKAWGLYQPSISTGAAYADLDNDGDMDLIVNNSNEAASIFENNSMQLLANHYLKIRLKGEGANTFGIGARVLVKTDSLTQMQELYPARGFQSSVEQILHFGLGAAAKVNALQVIWPDGKQTHLHNLDADTTLTLAASDAHNVTPAPDTARTWFTDVTQSFELFYTHVETNFVDFKSQYLLPYQVSKQGPFLANGDVNGDGYEDVFVGGNYKKPGSFFCKRQKGVSCRLLHNLGNMGRVQKTRAFFFSMPTAIRILTYF
jgi:hypothetical protein